LSSERAAFSLGVLTLACAKPQEAVNLVQSLLDAIELWSPESASRTGNLLMKAAVTNTLGTLLAGLGRHEAAVTRIRSAIDLAEKAGDDDMQDRFRGNLAISLEALGEIDEARVMLESALEGYRQRNDPVPIAFGLTGLAAYNIRQFRLDDAEEYATEAIEWATHAGDERLRGIAVNDLGMIAKLRGDYATALERFEEAEQVFDFLGDDAAAVAAAGNRAEVLTALGQLDEAEVILQSTLKTNQHLERLENQAATLLSLASLNRERGNDADAERWLSGARDLSRAIGDSSNEAFALFRLATLKNDLGQFEEAADFAQTALPLVSGKNDALTADLWFQRGRANLSLGYVGRAEEAFREAMVLAERVGATRVVAAATQNLGTCLLLMQRDGEAATAFADARDLWHTLNDENAVAYCAFCESAVRLDAKVAALSDAGHAATDWAERQAAAREMVSLYPELIGMYEQIGALQLVAAFCVSAASTAHFINEDAHAIDWYTRAGSMYRDMGTSERARDAFTRAERLLQYHVNALLQRSQMQDAMPLLLELANVSGQLGHHEAQATAMYNAAIGSIQTNGDYEQARLLASGAADLFAPDSDDAEAARRLAAYCVVELQRGATSRSDAEPSHPDPSPP
jgi:tetratricopeptide (TPR) repeat protein